MATDVSSLVRILEKFKAQKKREIHGGNSLVDGDLKVEKKELDLNWKIPIGWEQKLDLSSGDIYIRKCRSLTPPRENLITFRKLQDLNFPPSSSNPRRRDLSDLKLQIEPATDYQGMCTIHHVKSALDRAEQETKKKRPRASQTLSPSQSSPSSASSITAVEFDLPGVSHDSIVAVGCTTCFTHVLTPLKRPKCPKCNSILSPQTSKRPRLDLNIKL